MKRPSLRSYVANLWAARATARQPSYTSTDDYLPRFPDLAEGFRKGRNVYQGYQRGWGLEFGELRSKILRDPLYRDAMHFASGRTIMAELNRMNIYLILRFFLQKGAAGHIIEFGSYLGGNAIFMAHIAARLHPGMRVFALDTFEGMPTTDKSVDVHSKGDFAGVDVDELRRYVASIGLTNLEYVKGYFEETAPQILASAEKIAVAHIDCDILTSVRYSYETVKPYMVNGGYLVFDDATVSSCTGATEVVEDLVIRRDCLNSEQIFPHFVFRSFRT